MSQLTQNQQSRQAYLGEVSAVILGSKPSLSERRAFPGGRRRDGQGAVNSRLRGLLSSLPKWTEGQRQHPAASRTCRPFPPCTAQGPCIGAPGALISTGAAHWVPGHPHPREIKVLCLQPGGRTLGTKQPCEKLVQNFTLASILQFTSSNI